MEFHAEESSNIKRARYDPATQTLQVDFRGTDGNVSSTYEYSGFSADDWADFCNAKKKGVHFASAIRFARNADNTLKYPYRKVA